MSAEKANATIKLSKISGEENSQDFSIVINKIINPPIKLNNDEIYIRAMYLVSDQVNLFGGRFPVEELDRLQSLIVNSPVLVGHRKDKLPIARNFLTKMVEKKGVLWIKSYFYWLKESDQAETLKNNIDGGIYKECSIGFTFNFAECSICSKDIRECQHRPLRIYKPNKFSKIESSCYFNYREVDRVLETSLVYRGANPETSLTNELSLENLKNSSDIKYLVRPFYHSIPVVINLSESNELILERSDNDQLFGQIDIGADQESKLAGLNFPVKSLIVGYRGKERLSVEQLSKHLGHENSSVSRIELKIIPEEIHMLEGYESLKEIIEELLSLKCSIINHRFVSEENIEEATQSVETKDGVVVSQICTYINRQEKKNNKTEIMKSGSPQKYYLQLQDKKIFEIMNFSPELLDDGRIFLLSQFFDDGGEELSLTAYKKVNQQKITICPAVINGRNHWLLKKENQLEN